MFAFVFVCWHLYHSLFSLDPPDGGKLAKAETVEEKFLQVNQWRLWETSSSSSSLVLEKQYCEKCRFLEKLHFPKKAHKVENISIANLKQDDESVGDCDADCHDKDEVVDDEHLVRREQDKAPTDTWLAFTL